jgi:hypothetical protein
VNHKYDLENELKDYFPISAIIHGGCANSADELAGQFAHERDITEIVYKPNWEAHGRSAGFRRNQEMVQLEDADLVVAIWDGKSKGTEHTIRLAVQEDIPVHIIPAGY